jgi:hypothetical protein
MTKTVRIENADTSTHKIRVIVQHKNQEGVWESSAEVIRALDYPTAMAEFTVYANKRLIIEEYV